MADLLPILFAAVVSPILTAACKRARWARDVEAWAAVNLGLAVALSLFIWVIADRDPSTAAEWMTRGLAAAGLGGAANNVYRKRTQCRPRPPILGPRGLP